MKRVVKEWILDSVGKGIEIIFKKRQIESLHGRKIEKLLIFEGGGIGDIVRLFPSVEVFRSSFPNASIFFLVQYPEVLNLLPLTDQMRAVRYDMLKKHRGIIKKILLSLSLRRERFDLVFTPSRGEGTREALFMSFLMGGKYRLGFFLDSFGLLNSMAIEIVDNVPIVDQNIALLKRAGLRASYNRRLIQIPRDAESYAERVVGQKHSPLVCVHMGVSGQREHRTWPVDNFIELMRKCLETFQINVVVIGSKDDVSLKKEVASLYPSNRVVDLIGNTTIIQMAALIERSDIFIGCDSGPMHIAHALGKPFLAIFGPTSPEQVLPVDDPNIVIVRSKLDCSPCYLHQSLFRPRCNGNDCMRAVTVDEVFGRVCSLLRKGGVFANRN